jgi:tetratricopeptide (TPR) repeat protein
VSLVRIPGTARPRTFDEVKSAAVITDLERALKLVDERKFDEAIAVYRGVLERAPTLTSVQLAMARALRAKPDLPQARATLDKLLAAEPGNHRARLELGLTLEQSGESAAAAREFEQIVRDAPDSPVATTAREKLTALGRSAPGL